MIPVLFYSHVAEPVTQAILTSGLDKDLSLVKLSLSNLLKDTSIFDEINNDEVKIEWTLPSGEKIHNSEKYYLLNRVLSIPDELFEDFDSVDKTYSMSEFRAYLTFAIESFPKCSAKPGPFGLSGNRFSLPRQWETVSKAKLPLAVPEYYLGDLSLIEPNSNLVYSTPHNYYFWKPNKDLHDSSSFAFERPPGIPIICSVAGDEVEVYPYQQDEQINSSGTLLFKELAFRLAHLFDSPIAEILLFFDTSLISFGMISNIPYASKNKPWFKSLLRSFLQKELSR